MRVALAQINTTVGDIAGNAEKVIEWSAKAAGAGCDLVVFPELTIPGYPAEDLYLQPHFAAACAEMLEKLAGEITGISALVGYAEPGPGPGPELLTDRQRASAFNSLALIADGRIEAVYRKMALPNHGVFDEIRQFLPGTEPRVPTVAGTAVGLTVCEDCWNGGEPARHALGAGAEIIVNASASPWYLGRADQRSAIFSRLAAELARPLLVCNQVGAQDGLVFDGASLAIDSAGNIIAQAAQFEEDLLVVDLGDPPGRSAQTPEAVRQLDELRSGLALGLRDYVEKNGFGGVVFGLSGGIDSALVAALAVEALGPEKVTCIVMPSPHSSEATQSDAREMAQRLGARLIELPIAATMAAFEDTLEAAGEAADGVAVENLQARIRGDLVMAISNRDGLLALSCGNKSEASVGYATLYGDMAGGLAPIKDLPKTIVYRLAEQINETGLRPPARSGTTTGPIERPIPADIIRRPPSAELSPGQRDTDSLPPYDLLDQALEAHIERDLGLSEMVAEGIDPEVAARVVHLVAISEHKRHQSAPGIRTTAKSLDRDRRMPITNRYRST